MAPFAAAAALVSAARSIPPPGLSTGIALAELPSSVDVKTLALVDNASAETQFAAGAVVKTIVGGLKESGME